jgi:hypothetical protein
MVLASMVSMYRSGAEKLRLIRTGKQAYRHFADPTFETYGPKTDPEYDALIAKRGGLPA